jgi:hypothetical protein
MTTRALAIALGIITSALVWSNPGWSTSTSPYRLAFSQKLAAEVFAVPNSGGSWCGSAVNLKVSLSNGSPLLSPMVKADRAAFAAKLGPVIAQECPAATTATVRFVKGAAQSEVDSQMMARGPSGWAPVSQAQDQAQSPFQQFLDAMKKGVQNGIAGQQTSPVQQTSMEAPDQQGPGVQDTMLYRLFDKYPYDTKKPFAIQYPRVALTIVSAPPNHAQLQQRDFGGGFIPGDGCWTVRAKVWSSANASQNVGPFQWCSPRDLPKDYQPGARVTIIPCDGCSPQSVPKNNNPTGSAMAMQRGTRNRLLSVAGVSGFQFYEWLSRSRNYAIGADTTGTQRTDGPVPPDAAVPTDVAHRRYFDSSSGQFDVTLNDGAMVLLMFDDMDFDLTNPQDRRVWFVKFEPALSQ